MPYSGDAGPVRGVVDATRAVRGHLQEWLPTYLYRVREHLALPDEALPEPRSWRTPLQGGGIETIHDGQLPSVSVIPAGTVDVTRHGNMWSATWLLDIVVFARGVHGDYGYDATAETLGGYVTAVHLAVAQHRGVGDLDSCRWRSELIEAVEPTSARTLGQATVTVSASYEDVVQEWPPPEAPPDPVSDPIPAAPTVAVPKLTLDQSVP